MLACAVDWDAAGSWAGAFATALAVYLAATLADRGRRRERLQSRKDRYHALLAIFREAEDLLSEISDCTRTGYRGVTASPPSPERFSDLIDALSSISILDLGDSWSVMSNLFGVRRMLIEGRDALRKFVDEKASQEELETWCLSAEPFFRLAAQAAARASTAGKWPWKNRAGEWVGDS